MNITQLTEIANKVYMNREVQADREAKKRMRKASLLAAALKEMTKRQRKTSQEGGSLGPHLARDQWAYCKEKGHWKNECLNRGKALKPSLPGGASWGKAH